MKRVRADLAFEYVLPPPPSPSLSFPLPLFLLIFFWVPPADFFPNPGTGVRIVDTPIPKLESPDQVLIRVVVSGSNPKDWKLPDLLPGEDGTNQGDDIAGIVEEVGANVYEFKPGDRVAAFHEMRTRGGSYAEYAVAWAHTTFHIPKETSFEGG